MVIYKYIRIWFIINDIKIDDMASKIGMAANNISEIIHGKRKKIPDSFIKGFKQVFGFEPTKENLVREIEKCMNPDKITIEPCNGDKIMRSIREDFERSIYKLLKQKFEN
jgi:transcriptional regulator with XRE-family HTH domain